MKSGKSLCVAECLPMCSGGRYGVEVNVSCRALDDLGVPAWA